MELVKQDFTAIPAVIVAGGSSLPQTNERMKRAMLARVALGYRQLSLAVAEVRTRLTLEAVEEGLREAGVQVFDNADVSRYKANFRARNWGTWWTTPIQEYEQPIPEFAIDTALKVKKAIPEAEFSVEYFERRWGRGNDPFLSFKVPGVLRRFVVEVWDEPDFLAERKDL